MTISKKITEFMIKKQKNQPGFTLIELLIVMAIITILASFILPSFTSGRRRARDANRITDIRAIQTSLELYFDSNRVYPTALSQLVTAGLLQKVPEDPLAVSGCTGFNNCNYSYAYYPTAPITYHLGASLEDPGHVALVNDRDCNSTSGAGCPTVAAYIAGGFNGADGTGCDGTAGKGCYDVTP